MSILDKVKITDKTRRFLSNLLPTKGKLVKNSPKKRKEGGPDFVGWARLSNGIVIAIHGKLIQDEGGITMPLDVIEVPDKMIGEDGKFTAKVPIFKDLMDEWVEMKKES